MMSQAQAMALDHITTGIPSTKLGMWLFLASEVMFFTGLIAAYIVLRMSHPAWPGSEGHLSVPIGTVNTLLLLGSSVTIALALGELQANRRTRAALLLVATIILGSGFLVVKGFEYSEKFHHGLFPSTTIFWSCYFTLTGFHALHVLGGVLYNLWVFSKLPRQKLDAASAYVLELAGLYWHFVDIVWLFLFPLLYLL